MAITLITTAMSSSANSYCSLTEANSYFETKYHNDTWDDADNDQKSACLAWATRLLDQEIIWGGYKYTETQALRWPRSGLLDDDGFSIDYLTIPQFLKNATAELAEYLIANDRTAEDETKGFKKLKVGSLEMQMDKSDRKTVIPESVYSILAGYGTLKKKRSNKLVRV